MSKVTLNEYEQIMNCAADKIAEWQDRAAQLKKALGMVLDSLGALSNPSELNGYGLTYEQQTYILAAHASTGKAEEI